MISKVAVFFPHNPYPGTTGAHKRCLEIISSLRRLGASVHLLSSTLWSDVPWQDEAVESLLKYYVSDISLYHPRRLPLILRKADKKLHPHPPLGDAVWIPFGMRAWFRSVITNWGAEAVLTSYAFWDDLLGRGVKQSCVAICDNHELATLQVPLEKKLWSYIPRIPLQAEDISDEFIDDDFYNSLTLSPAATEFEIYNSYTHTISITDHEAQLIQEHCPKTNSVCVPATHQIITSNNPLSGPALYPIGPNPLNIQGYAWFALKVLPIVLKHAPDFLLRVTGLWSKTHLFPAAGVSLDGFIKSIDDVYRDVRFLICPALGGTGQQVKVVEAMARGIPVIAHAGCARNQVIASGENGFIASSAEEFAEQTIHLWQNPELRRIFGCRAQASIQERFSESAIDSIIRNLLA